MPEKKAAQKTPSKKAGPTRAYSPAASASVEREMKAMKQGRLRSSTGAKVTNPKQAIAIGLSEARREGDDAPAPPKAGSSKKTAAKKTAAKKSPAKKVK